jgi:hypothetical protein
MREIIGFKLLNRPLLIRKIKFLCLFQESSSDKILTPEEIKTEIVYKISGKTLKDECCDYVPLREWEFSISS